MDMAKARTSIGCLYNQILVLTRHQFLESSYFCVSLNCQKNLVFQVFPLSHVDSTRSSLACSQFTFSLIFPFSMKILVPKYTDYQSVGLSKSNCTKSFFFSATFSKNVPKWRGRRSMNNGGYKGQGDRIKDGGRGRSG